MSITVRSIPPNVLNALLDVLSYVIVALTTLVMVRVVRLSNQQRLAEGRGIPLNQLGKTIWSASDIYTSIKLSQTSCVVLWGFVLWILIVVVHPVADLFLEFETEWVAGGSSLSVVTYPFYDTMSSTENNHSKSDWLWFYMGLVNRDSEYVPTDVSTSGTPRAYVELVSLSLELAIGSSPLIANSLFRIRATDPETGEVVLGGITGLDESKNWSRTHYQPQSQGSPDALAKLLGGVGVNCTYQPGMLNPSTLKVDETVVTGGSNVTFLRTSVLPNCTTEDWATRKDSQECQGPVALVDDCVISEALSNPVVDFDSWILNATGDVALWGHGFTGNVAFSWAASSHNVTATLKRGPLLLHPDPLFVKPNLDKMLPTVGEIRGLEYTLLTVLEESACMVRGHISVPPIKHPPCRRPLMDKEKACVLMTLVECSVNDGLATCDRFGKVLSFLVTGYTPDIEDLEMMVRKPNVDIADQLVPSDVGFTKELAAAIARTVLSSQALRWSGEMVPQYSEQVVAVIEWPYFFILTLCLTLSVISWIMVGVSTHGKRRLPVPEDVWEGIQVGILEGNETKSLFSGSQNDSTIPARTSVEPFHSVDGNLVYGAKAWSKDSQQLGITVAPVEVPNDTCGPSVQGGYGAKSWSKDNQQPGSTITPVGASDNMVTQFQEGPKEESLSEHEC